ncbi:MAG: hypothetical protein P8Y51_06505, partial [Campylobacterales bacterium]
MNERALIKTVPFIKDGGILLCCSMWIQVRGKLIRSCKVGLSNTNNACGAETGSAPSDPASLPQQQDSPPAERFA